MSAYDNDPRVTPVEFGAFLVADGARYRGHVFQRDSGDWAARGGHEEPGYGVTKGFDTADEAIRSLIGEPQ